MKANIVDGKLDLSNQDLKDLSSINPDKDLKILILDNNQIDSFRSLKIMPNLEEISCRNNPIKYLNDLERQPKLAKINLEGCEICKENKFRVRVLATIGDKLKILNGTKLTHEERTEAHACKKTSPDQLFSPKVAKEEENENDPYTSELARLYFKEHSDLFDNFAMNEAINYDLKRFGPLPSLSSRSSAEDRLRAKINYDKRSSYIEKLILTLDQDRRQEKR